MAGNQQVDFSPDIFAIFVSLNEVFSDDECARVSSVDPGRRKESAVLLNSL